VVSDTGVCCRVDTFKSVEASLRVDALTSAGFRMSRSKLADLIRCVV
jgi:RNA-binding protein YlmH